MSDPFSGINVSSVEYKNNTEMPRKLPVFNNLRAWFSASVPHKTKDVWKKQGGIEVTSLKDSNFIFSNDATFPDTVDVFESEEFMQGFLAVFHTNYIDACLMEKTAHEVAAAQYILLPSDMADDIKKLAFVSSTSDPKKTETLSSTRQVESTNKNPDATSDNTNTNHNLERLMSEPCNSSSTRKSLDFAHAADIAFKIDNLESIPHVKSLPRFEGEIKDFVPGVNGCSLFLKA